VKKHVKIYVKRTLTNDGSISGGNKKKNFSVISEKDESSLSPRQIKKT
jgi:hypothetical protein